MVGRVVDAYVASAADVFVVAVVAVVVAAAKVFVPADTAVGLLL